MIRADAALLMPLSAARVAADALIDYAYFTRHAAQR